MTLHQFNPGKKSWKIYANSITSISGDDLTLTPYHGENLILEVSGNNDIIFKGNTKILAELDISNNKSYNDLSNNDNAVLNLGQIKEYSLANSITSISGDDLTLTPYHGQNLILEVSGNNDIIFKGNTKILAELDISNNKSYNDLSNNDNAVLNLGQIKEYSLKNNNSNYYAQFTNENDLDYNASQGGWGSDLDGGGSHTNSKLIKFDTTEYINPSNIITNDNGSNGSTFTVNISGKYLISASIKVTHSSNLAQNLEVYLTQQDTNGNIIKSRTIGEVNYWPAQPYSQSHSTDPNLTQYMAYRTHSMSNSIIFDFSTNDTIQLYARMNDRGNSTSILTIEAKDANLNFMLLDLIPLDEGTISGNTKIVGDLEVIGTLKANVTDIYALHIKQTSNQTGIPHNVTDTELINLEASYHNGYQDYTSDFTSNRWYPSLPGLYMHYSHVTIASTSTDSLNRAYTNLEKSGSILARSIAMVGTNNSDNFEKVTLTMQHIINVTQSDIDAQHYYNITMFVYLSSSSQTAKTQHGGGVTGSDTYLTIHKIA